PPAEQDRVPRNYTLGAWPALPERMLGTWGRHPQAPYSRHIRSSRTIQAGPAPASAAPPPPGGIPEDRRRRASGPNTTDAQDPRATAHRAPAPSLGLAASAFLLLILHGTR